MSYRNDSRDALGQQIRHGLGHRQVGLARARGPDAEHHVVLIDGFEIPALCDGLGRHLTTSRRAARALEEVVLQLDIGILGDELCGHFHVAPRKAVAVAKQAGQLRQYPLGPAHLVGITLDHDVMAAGLERYAERGFEASEVFVEGAKQGLDALIGHGHAAHDGSRHSLHRG
jgi:hypothetical protein